MNTALELFAGIGGAAAALRGLARVVCAVDTDQDALATYRIAFPTHPTAARNLAPLKPAAFAAWPADLWWMSPPCQPHTLRGNRLDLDDRRSDAFRAVLGGLEAVRPAHLALENVPSFAGSASEAALIEVLERCGYRWARAERCLSEHGWPVRRRRYYLVASQAPLRPIPPPALERRRLSEFLGPEVDRALLDIPPPVADRFGDALHIVDAGDPDAECACFTSAYGKSPVAAGSYLRDDRGVRRFSPGEIARLHGLPDAFPEALSLRKRWSLVGNSLAVPVVRSALSAIW